MAVEEHHLPDVGEQHQASARCPCRPSVERTGPRHTVWTHHELRVVVDPIGGLMDQVAVTLDDLPPDP